MVGVLRQCYPADLTTSILIRARSVVQVHPGPPFKSPVNPRLFSLFPFRGISLKKPFCQPFVNFRIGRMKPERLASTRLCREQRTWKVVQDTARLCKEREVHSYSRWKAASKCKQQLGRSLNANLP